MFERSVFIAGLGLALAACSGAEEAENAASGDGISLDEVAERASNSQMRPDPGEYQSTMEVLEVDIPGAPEGTADMLRGMMSSTVTKYCLSEEDVEKGFEQMAQQSQEGDCNIERFDMTGGTFDGRMTCNVPGQGSMTMTMQGEGAPTSSTVDITMKGDFAGMGESTMRMRAKHERLGDCP